MICSLYKLFTQCCSHWWLRAPTRLAYIYFYQRSDKEISEFEEKNIFCEFVEFGIYFFCDVVLLLLNETCVLTKYNVKTKYDSDIFQMFALLTNYGLFFVICKYIYVTIFIKSIEKQLYKVYMYGFCTHFLII